MAHSVRAFTASRLDPQLAAEYAAERVAERRKIEEEKTARDRTLVNPFVRRFRALKPIILALSIA
jgi:hypothetical protein